MTEAQAQRAANVLLGAAAVGVAIVVLRHPPVRRMLWRLARTAVAAAGPALMAEAQRAWAESGTRPHGI